MCEGVWVSVFVGGTREAASVARSARKVGLSLPKCRRAPHAIYGPIATAIVAVDGRSNSTVAQAVACVPCSGVQWLPTTLPLIAQNVPV